MTMGEGGGVSDWELRRRALVTGLVGSDPERQRLYQTSQSFHLTVDTLVQMLPAMVNGLAEGAREADLMIAAAIEAEKAAAKVMSPEMLRTILDNENAGAQPPEGDGSSGPA